MTSHNKFLWYFETWNFSFIFLLITQWWNHCIKQKTTKERSCNCRCYKLVTKIKLFFYHIRCKWRSCWSISPSLSLSHNSLYFLTLFFSKSLFLSFPLQSYSYLHLHHSFFSRSLPLSFFFLSLFLLKSILLSFIIKFNNILFFISGCYGQTKSLPETLSMFQIYCSGNFEIVKFIKCLSLSIVKTPEGLLSTYFCR